MTDVINKIKIKKPDGTMSDYIPIGAEAKNVIDEDSLSISYKINKKPYYFNSVADMKNAKLKNGDCCITLGYYDINDGGGATYRIRIKIESDNEDNGLIVRINDTLIAELIIDNNLINVKQLGVKEGEDCSLKINNYFSLTKNFNGLFFPKGQYLISQEIDTLGSVIMSEEAYFLVTQELDCGIFINKNYEETDSVNKFYRNLELKINIDCNELGKTGIATRKLHWAKCTFTVLNPILYGVKTKYLDGGHFENTFDIQVSYKTSNKNNDATGIYIGGSDDIYNNIIVINCKYGVELKGGDNCINVIHGWLYSKELWTGSILLKIGNVKNHINSLICDTYETGIYLQEGGIFHLIVDFMYGMINLNLVPAELARTYVIWNMSKMNETSRKNSNLIILNYVGNDTYTSDIKLADNGKCPWNTQFHYKNDYKTALWSYPLEYMPDGSFICVGNQNIQGMPSEVTAGAWIINCTNNPYGKTQQMINSEITLENGNTIYNSTTLLPTSNFMSYYYRVLNKWGKGNSIWGKFSSYKAIVENNTNK